MIAPPIPCPARAMIKTGQSCGVSVPLTAVLYGSAGTVVQVVRRARIETKRVEVGLMDGGRIVGSGTHGQLLADNETYREIVYSQMSEKEAAA